MQVNPYLHYDGNCETAFRFYEKAIGAKVKVMMTHEAAPPEMPVPADWKKKIMHGRVSVDGQLLMGADSPPRSFPEATGLFSDVDGR